MLRMRSFKVSERAAARRAFGVWRCALGDSGSLASLPVDYGRPYWRFAQSTGAKRATLNAKRAARSAALRNGGGEAAASWPGEAAGSIVRAMRWGAVVAVGLAGTLAACSTSKPKPIEPERGATQTGIASWYGPGFHGRRTSSGEVYNQYDLTAAHQTLPHGTRVQVTNLTNGRSVLVRINDRGPFVDDRIIDLSYAAARQIDMIGPGTAMVQVEIVGPEWSNPVQVAEAILPPATDAPPAPAAIDPPPAPPAAHAPPAPPLARAPVPRPVEVAASIPPPARYAVQVGAFADFERARQTQHRLELQGTRVQLGLVEEAGIRYYRLRVGPFNRQDDAARTVERINALGFPALIVADRPVWQ